MAHAIRRDDDPLTTIDILQSQLTDLQAVVDAAAYVDGEPLPEERRRFTVSCLIDVARRLTREADDEINRFNAATWQGAKTRPPPP